MVLKQPRIVGPDGGGEFPSTTKFLHLIFDRGGVYEYQRGFGVAETIDGKDLPTALNTPESEIFSDGDLHIYAIATHHDDCPSVGYRIAFKDQSITFSGDMDGLVTSQRCVASSTSVARKNSAAPRMSGYAFARKARSPLNR